MKLNLDLLPVVGEFYLQTTSFLDQKVVHCHDRLNLDPDNNIFSQLIDCGEGNKPTVKINPIPPQMWVETHECGKIRGTNRDKYGNTLTFIYAGEFKDLKFPVSTSQKNKAIKAFVDALPDNIPIILWWI